LKNEDDEFEQELQAAPWAFGQLTVLTIFEVIYRMREQGLNKEADWLLREWTILSQK
jgi:hypothetical protein